MYISLSFIFVFKLTIKPIKEDRYTCKVVKDKTYSPTKEREN